MEELIQNLEVNIISNMLNYPKESKKYINTLDDSFFTGYCRDIFKAIKELSNKNEPIDITTVHQELQKYNKGISVVDLTNMYTLTPSFNLKYHLERIEDYRNRIKLQQDITHYSNKIFDLKANINDIQVDMLNQLQRNLENTKMETESITAMSAYEELFNNADDIAKGLKQGLSFDISSLDSICRMSSTDLVTLAAKSSVGKTSLAIHILHNLVVNLKKKVLFVTREMSRSQIMEKLLAYHKGITSFDIQKHRDDEEKTTKNLGEVYGFKHIVDKYYKKLDIVDYESTNQIKTAVVLKKYDVVIVDYIQILNDPSERHESRERQVANMSRKLKSIALNSKHTVIIQLAQLNDESGDNLPQGDRVLRESKSIYHDSNIVLYLHRPNEGQMDKLTIECSKNNINIDKNFEGYLKNSGKEILRLQVDKNRGNVANKTLTVVFNKKRSIFKDLRTEYNEYIKLVGNKREQENRKANEEAKKIVSDKFDRDNDIQQQSLNL